MKKRVNPLDEVHATSHTLSKRVNPLEINTHIEVPVVKTEAKEVALTIEAFSKVSRKFIFARTSKSLVATYKKLYPETKFGLLLENALLQYLHETHKEAYDALVAELMSQGVSK